MKPERRAARKEIDDLILVDPVHEIETAAQVIIESQSLHSFTHALFSPSHQHIFSIFWKRYRNILPLYKNQWPANRRVLKLRSPSIIISSLVWHMWWITLSDFRESRDLRTRPHSPVIMQETFLQLHVLSDWRTFFFNAMGLMCPPAQTHIAAVYSGKCTQANAHIHTHTHLHKSSGMFGNAKLTLLALHDN